VKISTIVSVFEVLLCIQNITFASGVICDLPNCVDGFIVDRITCRKLPGAKDVKITVRWRRIMNLGSCCVGLIVVQ